MRKKVRTRPENPAEKTEHGTPVGYWRGFSKYRQEDGQYVAVASDIKLGPVATVKELDRAITAFYGEGDSIPANEKSRLDQLEEAETEDYAADKRKRKG